MKNVFLLCALSGLLLFSACKSQKNTAQKTEEEMATAAVEAKQDTQFQRKFFEAERQKAIGNYDKALENYYTAVAIKEVPSVHFQIAQLEAQAGNNEIAIKQAKIALDADLSNPYIGSFLGEISAYNGKYQEAAAYYLQAGKAGKEYTQNLYEAARLYSLIRDVKSAIAAVDIVEQETGVTEETSSIKQNIYLENDRPDDAINALQQLVDRYPNTPRYQLALADAHYGLNKPEEGFAILQKVAKSTPNDGQLNMRLFDHYYNTKESEKAFEYLKKGLESDEVPFYDKVNVMMGLIAAPKEPVSNGALRDLLSILRENHPSEARAYALSGDFEMQQGNSGPAATFYEQVLDLDPNQNSYWKSLLSLQLESGKFAELSSSADKALERYPTDADFYFLKGLGELRTGNSQGAITWLETGLDYVLSDRYQEGRFYSALGEAFHENKDYAKSDEAFDKALLRNPVDIIVLNNYAYFLSERGSKLEKATEMIEKVIFREPNSPVYLDTYAWVLYKKEAFAEALVQMEKAISLSTGEDAETQEHYGDILLANGLKDQAIKAYESALRLGANSTLIQNKIAAASK